MKKAMLGLAVTLVAARILMPTLGFTSADVGKKEGKACNVCHAMPPKKDNLTAVGKCYAEKKDFKACEGAK